MATSTIDTGCSQVIRTIRQIVAAMTAVSTLGLVACGDQGSATNAAIPDVDVLAREYVSLELAMGRHDPAHVDAYFGPKELVALADQAELSPAQIIEQADALVERLEPLLSVREGRPRDRLRGLLARLTALRTRASMAQGERLSFDEEARALFGVTPPRYEAAHFDALLVDIEALLPGEGPLADRVSGFLKSFEVPAERLDAVFQAAIGECRTRTLAALELPAQERFTLEYVSDKPWSGYNWYQGDSESLIQVNTDLPQQINRAVDLGCHEGYPGHHTYQTLQELNLAQGEGWIEYTVQPLFSPSALLAEGSANYGIRVAFPGEEQVEFERRVLWPLAGLEAGEAERYYALQRLRARLSYARNEAARGYLDGRMTREQAVDWIVRYNLVDLAQAEKSVDFIETYRSYVVNYNLGQDLVRDYVERVGGDRWASFTRLLSVPMIPADLLEP
ncbi:MAG: hypothetical protein AAGA68_24130 [Pseudomonadota bacterium]